MRVHATAVSLEFVGAHGYLPPVAAAAWTLEHRLRPCWNRPCWACVAAMALLLKQLNPAISQYKDRRFNGSQQQFDECLHSSTTVYVGNLSFYTTEDQIFEVKGAVDCLCVGKV
jgi:hypothetical protein